MVKKNQNTNNKSEKTVGSDADSQPDQEEDEPNKTPDQEEDEPNKTPDQSASSPSDYLTPRNIGKWTAEAFIADRVVSFIDITYNKAKQSIGSGKRDDKNHLDLAKQTKFAGTKFNVFFFDGEDEMWSDIIDADDSHGKYGELAAPPRNFSEIISRGELPLITVDSVSIEWYEDYLNQESPENRNASTIYTDQNVSELNVILPDSGRCVINAEVDDQETQMRAQYKGDFDTGAVWMVAYSRSDFPSSGPYDWYVPIPHLGRVDGERIVWYD
ncbi:hypothetical protein [Halorubrum lipolyticum]|uniref:hypothetical protein n=1 Tax=Halorubrum lipolyticum TaxID=368624 RepID=UPI0011C7204A|nr:hypothetical protein [Halorubrum lipolyticum]